MRCFLAPTFPLARSRVPWLAVAVLLSAAWNATAGAEPIPLTTGSGNDTEAVFSPDARRVVFQSDRSGTLDLYQLDLATKEVTPLVAGPGHACFPAFSPDGKWVVYSYAHFTTTAFEGIEHGYNLFVIPAEGGEARRLTSGRPPRLLSTVQVPTVARSGSRRIVQVAAREKRIRSTCFRSRWTVVSCSLLPATLRATPPLLACRSRLTGRISFTA